MSSSLSLRPPPDCLPVSARRPLFPLSALSSGLLCPEPFSPGHSLFRLPSAGKPCLLTASLCVLCLPRSPAPAGTYLWEDGDAEGLVADLAHQVEGDDREDAPGRGARLPADQLLPQPEAVGELLRLRARQGRGRDSPSLSRLPFPDHARRALCWLLPKYPHWGKVH